VNQAAKMTLNGWTARANDGNVNVGPSYLRLLATGDLEARAVAARRRMAACDLCARACGVDRTLRLGACRTGPAASIASWGPHHGEEAPLRGWAGSGTIFFSSCNLRCVYCQNHEISQGCMGRPVSADELADIMISLQQQGCHNVNFVSPSHVVAPILEAVWLAARRGLHLPLVYNTGGYDSLEALALLDGVIDIYMPDMKYGDSRLGRRFSRVLGYPEANRRAVREMHRQVGDLMVDSEGLAVRGLLVRHLVLPAGLAGTAAVARFLAEDISQDTYLNVMDQYRPAFRAGQFPPLDRRPTGAEVNAALRAADDAGLWRFDGNAAALAYTGPRQDHE
jgi:putative pyruvate formate lyase activating enzyme